MKSYKQVYIDRFMLELDNLEGIGGPETMAEYIAVLKAVRIEIEQRLAAAEEMEGNNDEE